MKKRVFLSKNTTQTQKFAAKIVADLLVKKSIKGAAVLALAGELGAGKTTFVQGLTKVMRIKGRVTSPSFVIMRRFKLYDLRFKNLFHIDCYRLDRSEDLVNLGLIEILKNPENLVVIEWADKVKKIIPKNAIWLKFKWISENQRKIYKFCQCLIKNKKL